MSNRINQPAPAHNNNNSSAPSAPPRDTRPSSSEFDVDTTFRDAIADAPRPAARDNTPAHAATSSSRFRIPGDVIARTCATLTEEQQAAIRWAAGYCRARNLSHEDFAAQLAKDEEGNPYSGDSVYALFTGRRNENPGSVAKLCASIDTLRRRVEETTAREGLPFVETNLSRILFERYDLARRKHRVVFVFGISQIGKTRIGVEYTRRNNHGATIFVRMPSGGRLRHFLQELALILGIGVGNKAADLRRRILECFTEHMLLIVDEAEECVDNPSGIEVLNFVREIHDRRKCGVVIQGAPKLRQALKRDHHLTKLDRRATRPLLLPEIPSKQDLQRFAESFGLDSAPDKILAIEAPKWNAEGDQVTVKLSANPLALQTNTVKQDGLGRWLAILEDAADIAKTNKRPLKWHHVIAAWDQFQME